MSWIGAHNLISKTAARAILREHFPRVHPCRWCVLYVRTFPNPSEWGMAPWLGQCYIDHGYQRYPIPAFAREHMEIA